MRDENKYCSDVIRDLVHEALRQRRLRTAGRDASELSWPDMLQNIAGEMTESVRNDLAELRQWFAAQTTLNAIPSTDVTQKLLLYLLQRQAVTEGMVKVLMTVGMQKDGALAEDIKRQLAAQEEAGARQARELIQKLTVNANEHVST
ncbi:MAG TPA: hypothetical protein PLD20_06435 [Blastocatellia bacterium]|nr:hypothetical protein [Blastocatellia bacterium]HMY70271.1 hypothetical protein [Blastocatellia bacterium]HMZ17545.1 hypothetical protein [Blastocatellia bacterium]